jgi:hypothetical protein
MESTSPAARRYSPVLMAIANLVIFGAPYLILNLYERFFIVIGVAFLCLVAKVLAVKISFLGLALIGQFGMVILGLVMVFDTYVQTKKINDGTLSLPMKKSFLSVLGIVLLVLFYLSYGAWRFMAAGGVDGPDQYGLRTAIRENNEKTAVIAGKYIPRHDAGCDALEKDSTLVEGSFFGQAIFTDYCYFKKAVEANDPLYCKSFGDDTRFNENCVAYLAIKNQKPEFCSDMLAYANLCKSTYQRGKNPIAYPCDTYRADMPSRLLDRCEQEFGQFHKTLLP